MSMLRPLFRRLLLVLFALALPVQGIAGVLAHACDAMAADHAAVGHAGGHDHAAHEHTPAADVDHQHGAHHLADDDAGADAADVGASSTCSACAPCCSVAAPVPLMLTVPTPLPQFSAAAPDSLPYHGADADALRRPPRSSRA